MQNFFRFSWKIMLKDLQVYLRHPTNIVVVLVPSIVFLLVQALGAAAVGRSPVALVNQDNGIEGRRIVQAIHNADVFRLSEVDVAQAQALYDNLNVVAIVTIPAGFSSQVETHQPASIDVQVNNLNLDFTNDIRRAVPDAITQYYLAQGNSSPIKITMNETNLRSVDVEFFQYAALPTIIMLLLIGGLITAGLSTAREFEDETIKELLLSPVPSAAIVTGKVLAGFVTSFCLGVIVLAGVTLLGWVHPSVIYWLVGLLVVALTALFGAGLGVAIGASIRHVMPVIVVSLVLTFYLFFLAGGVGVLAFEPAWLQQIAVFDPLTYGTHALQMALFYQSSDLLLRDSIVMALSALVTLIIGSTVVRRVI
jgi:ABC-type multidrug transport system permease subunit